MRPFDDSRHADRAAGQQAQDHDPLGVPEDDGRRQQHAQRRQQARVKGDRRWTLKARTTPPAASSTRNVPSPRSRNGRTMPASTPTPRQHRTARTLPGRRRALARTGRTGCPWPARAPVARSVGAGRAGVRTRLVMTGSWVRLGTCVGSSGLVGRSTRTRAPVLAGLRVDEVGWCRRAGRSPSGRWRGRGRCRRPRRRPPASRTARRRGPGRRRGCPAPRRRPPAASRSPSSCAVTRTAPPAGLWREALSSRLATSWWSRCRVGRDRQRGRRDPDVVRHLAAGDPRLGHRALQQRRGRAPGSVTAGPRRRPPGRGRAGRRPGRTSRSAWSSAVRSATGSGSADAVDEVLEHGAQRGQRRAELVAHVRHQLAALAVDGGQVLGHPVEGPGQLADLVVRGRGDPAGVVAAGHPPGGGGHLAQGRGHADREQLGHAEGQGDGDRDAEPERHPAAGADRGDDRRPR